MISLLKRLLTARHRIAFHLYMGIGTAVALTMVASLVAWFSFDQVGDAQRQVNERARPRDSHRFCGRPAKRHPRRGSPALGGGRDADGLCRGRHQSRLRAGRL